MDADKAGQAPEGAKDGNNGDAEKMAAQLKEMQERLEKVTAAQSGSDKKVQELLGLLETEKKEKMTVSQEKLTLAEQVKQINEKLTRAEAEKNFESQKALALELISGTDIPKELIIPYVGASDKETKDKVAGFLTWFKAKEETIRKETANKILGGKELPKSGDANSGTTTMTVEKYSKMPLAELKTWQREHPGEWKTFLDQQAKEPGSES